MLNERPGLQRIIYSAKYDEASRDKVFQQICEKAMQQKDANVHRVDDFFLGLSSLTPLFLGQKPDNVMIERRDEDMFSKLKSNFNNPSLVFRIFNERPKVQEQIYTNKS